MPIESCLHCGHPHYASHRIVDIPGLIADAQVERIMRMSDAEVLAEIRRYGEDPAEVAVRLRAQFDAVMIKLRTETAG